MDERYAHVRQDLVWQAILRMGKKSPIDQKEKRPPQEPLSEVEARAGVEPTYTDLQSSTARGAQRAYERRKRRA